MRETRLARLCALENVRARPPDQNEVIRTELTKDTLRTLERLGRTNEDSETAVKALKRRRSDRNQLTAGTQADADRIRLEKELDAAWAKFEPVQHRHNETVDRLSAEINFKMGVQTKARDARQRLVESCLDEEVLAKLNDLKSQEQQTQIEVRDPTEEVNRWSDVIRVRRFDPSGLDPHQLEASQARLDEARIPYTEAVERHSKAVEQANATQRTIVDFQESMVASDL